jgi:predicted DNA-binding transcriptional regulator AlpA
MQRQNSTQAATKGQPRSDDLKGLTSPSSETSNVELSAFSDDVEIAGRRYVRQRRLANLLGVSDRTVSRWTALGIGPPKITIGKTVLFDLGKVPDWLADRETVPTRNHTR